MLIEPFDIGSHGAFLNTWLVARSMEEIDFSEIPEVGFIAFIEGLPIAANFIRQCEGGVGILDSLISNPDAPGAHRHEAIDALVSKIIEASKKLEISRIIAFSIDASTLERSLRHGFLKQEHTLISLEVARVETVH